MNRGVTWPLDFLEVTLAALGGMAWRGQWSFWNMIRPEGEEMQSPWKVWTEPRAGKKWVRQNCAYGMDVVIGCLGAWVEHRER